MKERFIGKELVLIVCFIFFLSSLAFAQAKNVQSRGRVMELNFAKKTVIVNEKAFVWDSNTLFFDEKGSPISITENKLLKGTTVRIEATWIKNKPLVIKKLFLLPPK